MLAGAYWLRHPAPGASLAVVYSGAVAPEAFEAFDQIREDIPGAGLLAVTSPDRLYGDWSAARSSGAASHAEKLLAPLAGDARLVSVIDGPPSTLAWLGAVRGHKVAALGVDRFGQSGDIQDLYRAYGLDAEAIVDAAAGLIAA
jgi:pyruvate dehydrogenase E1 component